MTSPSARPTTRAALLLLLLATLAPPRGCHGAARQLRRASADDREDRGFQVVSSNDMFAPRDDDAHDGGAGASPLSRTHEAGGAGEGEAPPKEYKNDETLTFVDPADPSHARVARACGADEKLWSVTFRTDAYGYETSWSLEAKASNDDWTLLAAGPPGRQKYRDNTVYRGATCLRGDVMYRLRIMDAYADGFCCSFGEGYYQYKVDGDLEYDTGRGVRTFKQAGEHLFYVGLPTPEYGSIESYFANQGTPFSGRSAGCDRGEQHFRIKITTDNFPGDNAWEFKSLDTGRVIDKAESRDVKQYGKNRAKEMAYCIPYGKYRFTITDSLGDGMCCRQGNGQYELYMDGELILYGADFNSGRKMEHDIVAGYHEQYTQMTVRERQYLDAHNWRRKKYHEAFGAPYTPLKYDFSLQQDAAHWAEQLLDDCAVTGIDHEPGVEQGENLAKNTGNGKWGQLFPVENLVRRWFEREETWPYPANAHLTQGLWRSALYVGCAESEKEMGNKAMCRIQVCRYARAGNCDMNRYDAREGDNWKVPMLQLKNPCGPACPPNGCH